MSLVVALFWQWQQQNSCVTPRWSKTRATRGRQKAFLRSCVIWNQESGIIWIFDVCLANEDWGKFTDPFISCFHVALFIRQIWSQFVMNMSVWNKSCSQHIKRHLAYLLVFLLAHLLKGLGIQIATNTTLADYWHTFQSRHSIIVGLLIQVSIHFYILIIGILKTTFSSSRSV